MPLYFIVDEFQRLPVSTDELLALNAYRSPAGLTFNFLDEG
ncbi:MAG: hypothetical protein Q7R50_05030 [Dehalococcoidales bacterium]|nr:hypothetical protein [Dehalococcoidales bacterium]